LLTHAFRNWQVLRRSACTPTFANQRFARRRHRNASAGKFEGILRAHRMAADFIRPRDSARFSIVAAEWPEVKQRAALFAGTSLTVVHDKRP